MGLVFRCQLCGDLCEDLGGIDIHRPGGGMGYMSLCDGCIPSPQHEVVDGVRCDKCGVTSFGDERGDFFWEKGRRIGGHQAICRPCVFGDSGDTPGASVAASADDRFNRFLLGGDK